MGLFRRRPVRVLSNDTLESLSTYGRSVIRSRSVGVPDFEFGWGYIGPVVSAMGGTQRDAVIGELYDAAASDADRPYATVGAYSLLAESNDADVDPRFLEMLDMTLQIFYDLGFSSGHLTRREADRWIAAHGDLRTSFDRLVEIVVPGPGEDPDVAELPVGSTKLLAKTADRGDVPGNAFYAERHADGAYIVFSERPTDSDGATIARYEEDFLGTFQSLPDLLRALGRMFGSPPDWVDADLEPYFPRRRG